MAGFSLFGVNSHPPAAGPGSAGRGVCRAGQKLETLDYPLPLQIPPPACCHWHDMAAHSTGSQTEREIVVVIINYMYGSL